jgi:hypothetical protein
VGIIAVLVVFAAIASYFSWLENPRTVYTTYDDANRAGAVGPNRWIPDFLPKSASTIVEQHDIDSNASSLTFRFAGFDLQIPESCVSVPSEAPGAHSYNFSAERNWVGTGPSATARWCYGQKMRRSTAARTTWRQRPSDAQQADPADVCLVASLLNSRG